jgi:hypothetical protein
MAVAFPKERNFMFAIITLKLALRPSQTCLQWEDFQVGKGDRSLKLIAHLYLVPRLKMLLYLHSTYTPPWRVG